MTDKGLAKEETSSTLLTLLSNVFKKNFPALLIGNIATSKVTNKPTSLQIALGVRVRQKNMVKSLHDFGVTCSYDESLRFKASVVADDVNSKRKQFKSIMCVPTNYRVRWV